MCILFHDWIGIAQIRDHAYIDCNFWMQKMLGLAVLVSVLMNMSKLRRQLSLFYWKMFRWTIREGNIHYPIKSGQHIWVHFPHEHNSWIRCSANYQCTSKTTCSGTTAQGKNFLNNRYWGEIFILCMRETEQWTMEMRLCYTINVLDYICMCQFKESGCQVRPVSIFVLE